MSPTVQLEKAGGERSFFDYGIVQRHRAAALNSIVMVNKTRTGLLRDSLQDSLGSEVKRLNEALGAATLLGIQIAVDPDPQQQRFILSGTPDDSDDYQGLTWFSGQQLAVVRAVIDDVDGALDASVELGLHDAEQVRVPLSECTLVSLIDTKALLERVHPH